MNCDMHDLIIFIAGDCFRVSHDVDGMPWECQPELLGPELPPEAFNPWNTDECPF